jgi:iron complex outermembrane receptor protein
MRGDATSRFSKDNRWGSFPSVALGWKILDESWAKGLKDVMNEWKLRLGWGITGQQDVGGYFDYMSKYLASQQQSNYPSIKDGEYTTTLYPQGYNRNLKWEETTTWNAGFDFGFLNNRITAAVDYYYRQSKDLLSEVDVPAGTATTNRLVQNFGSLENQGVEFNITARPIVKKDLTWTINYNVAYNQNKITKLNNDGTMVKVGGISGGTGNTIQVHQTGYAPNSFFVYQQVYDQNGKPIEGLYVDRNEDGQIDKNDRYCYEKAAPDVTIGFNTDLSYKTWTLSVAAHSNIGNYVYNNIKSNGDLLTDLWTNSFINNRIDGAWETGFDGSAQYYSDYYVQNASFFKLDKITLSKMFQFGQEGKTPMNLNAFFTVQNVATITGYKGIDPEIFSGIDNNMYPRPRTFILGVKFNF